MDDKSKLYNSIITSLSSKISSCDMNIIKSCIARELEYVSVTSNTQIQKIINFDKNERLFKLFVASKRLEGMSERTIQRYVYETKKILLRFNKDVDEINTIDVQYYLSEYEQIHHVSKRTIENTRKAIKGFYIWATENNYIDENPLAPIKTIAYEKKPIQVLNDEEIYAVREKARESIRTRAIVELLLSTGIRVSELIAIDRKDIDFDKKEILIHCAKKRNKETRICFLTVEAKECLLDYLKYRNTLTSPDGDALFISNRDNGRRVTERLVNTTLRRIEREIGLKKHLTVHTFRKTMASRLHAKGMNSMEIAHLLGHADTRTCETYYIGIIHENVKQDYYKYS